MDGNFVPFAFTGKDGVLQGFNIDVVNEVARRLGREITIDNATWAGLIPALNAGRYDFLSAAALATRERAEMMPMVEGYMDVVQQFGILKGSDPLKSLSDLKGKSVAVSKGTVFERWARQNEKEYGFSVQAFDSVPNSIQAVMTGRADAVLSDNTLNFVAMQNPRVEPSITIPDTKTQYTFLFNRESIDLRNQIDEKLECMKLDGTLAKIYEKWFGAKAEDGSALVTPVDGFGIVDFPFFVETKDRQRSCP